MPVQAPRFDRRNCCLALGRYLDTNRLLLNGASRPLEAGSLHCLGESIRRVSAACTSAVRAAYERHEQQDFVEEQLVTERAPFEANGALGDR